MKWRWFVVLILLFGLPITEARAGANPRLPMLDNQAAWKRLPAASEPAQSLPAWARALAGPLPLTTARMLELDALHRSGDRLDARLRALTRWACADANQCDYAKTVAAADYARTGADASKLEGQIKDADLLPALDRAAVRFARQMMIDASALTDADMNELIRLAGEERTMALVALVAHASFQDRLLLALNIAEEAKNDPPPLTIRFTYPKPLPPKTGAKAKEAAAEPQPEKAAISASAVASNEWKQLQQELARQRARPGRIRVPEVAEVHRRLGPNHPATWQAGIIWSRVAYGYQPELTDAWFETAGAFRQEAPMDRLFANAIFWVVTDALRCFY